MENKILVFLSRPNPFNKKQEYFINKLKQELKNQNVETVTLQAGNYDLTDSLNYLKGMIRQCYGIVIVSFCQYFIEKGFKKKNSENNPEFFYPQEIDVSGQAITSPFCHIEGTIGLLYDLPLLIINETGVREEGIIKGGRFSVKTQTFELSCIDEFFNSDEFKNKVTVWLGRVKEYYLFLNLKKI